MTEVTTANMAVTLSISMPFILTSIKTWKSGHNWLLGSFFWKCLITMKYRRNQSNPLTSRSLTRIISLKFTTRFSCYTLGNHFLTTFHYTSEFITIGDDRDITERPQSVESATMKLVPVFVLITWSDRTRLHATFDQVTHLQINFNSL